MGNEIKICIVTTVSLTLKTFLLDQLAYLSKNGFRVTVICSHDPEFAKERPDIIEYIPVNMTRSIGILSTVAGLWELYRLFKNHRFDIIQYSTPKAALISSLAGFFAGIPVRLYCQWGIRYVALGGMTRGVFKLLEKITCLCSTDIAPDSRGNLMFSVEEGLYPLKKGAVVYNGSANGVSLKKFDISRKQLWRDSIRFALNISGEGFVFGFIGRITKDKGINELVSSFLNLAEHDHKVFLLLVGSKEEGHRLDACTLEAIEGHKQILAVGSKENPQEYIAAMDVMVLPSYREGFGIAAIESQAMGVPVISTDIPGPSEAVINGETGILVPPGQVEPLVAAMKKLKGNPDLLKSMGSKGYKYASENFEQSKFWEKVLEHRLRLIKRNTGVST